jgi:acyl-CoA synthetase (AMP-forming)/AMP-acid ligase II
MKGYLKNLKATDEAFAGGWFHSGDLGVMHQDGYVQLCGADGWSRRPRRSSHNAAAFTLRQSSAGPRSD